MFKCKVLLFFFDLTVECLLQLTRNEDPRFIMSCFECGIKVEKWQHLCVSMLVCVHACAHIYLYTHI